MTSTFLQLDFPTQFWMVFAGVNAVVFLWVRVARLLDFMLFHAVCSIGRALRRRTARLGMKLQAMERELMPLRDHS